MENSPVNQAIYILLTILLLAGLITAAWYAEYFNNRRYIESTTLNTKADLSLLRSQIQANLNSNIQIIKGLISVISFKPDLTQSDFARAAKPLFDGKSQLRNIGAAPGMVISLMYPLEGNEDALGLDYRTNPQQASAAKLAKATEQMVLAGPVALVQGGRGIIARVPVYTRNDEEQKLFWGLISAVIDADSLYRESGLFQKHYGINIALRGKDGLGDQGEVFFGDAAIFDKNPIILDIPLPYGKWQIAGIPENGWPSKARNIWQVRMLMLFIALLIIIPFIGLGVSIRALSSARMETERANAELQVISKTDTLTKIPNRRAFEERMTLEINRARRTRTELALLMVDVDYFKPYNDGYGHDAGDIALRRIAGALTNSLPRATDFAARLGGEEFVVLLPGTDINGACEVAERVHAAIGSLNIKHEYASDKKTLTVSIGAASLSANDLGDGNLFKQADEALYNAKAAGRDQTVQAI